MKKELITQAERKQLLSLGKQLEKLDKQADDLMIKARIIIGFLTPDCFGISLDLDSMRMESMTKDIFVDYAIKSRARFKVETYMEDIKAMADGAGLDEDEIKILTDKMLEKFAINDDS